MSTSRIPVCMRFLTVYRKSIDKTHAAGYNGRQIKRKESCCSDVGRRSEPLTPPPVRAGGKIIQNACFASFWRGGQPAHMKPKAARAAAITTRAKMAQNTHFVSAGCGARARRAYEARHADKRLILQAITLPRGRAEGSEARSSVELFPRYLLTSPAACGIIWSKGAAVSCHRRT
jgi:hypothetical protein